MNIGRLSNDDGEGNENILSYQDECAFFLTFISTLLKWHIYRWNSLWSLGDRTQVRRSNWICPCVYVLQTTSQKEIHGCVRTGWKEKRAGNAKFVVSYLLIGLIAVAVAVVVAPRIYRSKYGCILWGSFSKKNSDFLERLQNKAMRPILKANHLTCSQTMRDKLGLLTLSVGKDLCVFS